MTSNILALQLRMAQALSHFRREGFPPGDIARNVAARALGVPLSEVTLGQLELARGICRRAKVAPRVGPNRRHARVIAPYELPPLRWHERLIARVRGWWRS